MLILDDLSLKTSDGNYHHCHKYNHHHHYHLLHDQLITIIIIIITIMDITTRKKHRGQAGVMFLGGDQVELIGELLQDTRNTKHLKFYVKRGF